jgi:hypothetical protein
MRVIMTDSNWTDRQEGSAQRGSRESSGLGAFEGTVDHGDVYRNPSIWGHEN